jgi:hypothetical protein
MRLATAPVNWNNPDVPEYRAWIPYGRMMDEFVAAGYDACEWGSNMPNDQAILNPELYPTRVERHKPGSTDEPSLSASIRKCLNVRSELTRPVPGPDPLLPAPIPTPGGMSPSSRYRH